jgi:hypothetical protein
MAESVQSEKQHKAESNQSTLLAKTLEYVGDVET